MKIARLMPAAALLVLLSISAFAAVTADELAAMAVDGDAAASTAAMRKLRHMGPAGLEALLRVHAREIERFSASGESTDEWLRIRAAIDTVAMQRDAFASGLYWYTDLEAAKRAADSSNRPVLSLRLLGNLNEEFSCANSRLFRSILYANKDVARYLSENYILHWRSVRPAPRITIDFGDGRRIERTVTGNSIHYILDENGVIIDALPGLYSPRAFKLYLEQARKVQKTVDGLSEERLRLALMRYRKTSADRIIERRGNVLKAAGVELSQTGPEITAIDISPLAMTKTVVTDEISLLRVYDNFARFVPQIDLSEWQKMSAVYAGENGIDASSVAFIHRQNRDTGRTEQEFESLFKKLDTFVSLDTTRNDFLFRTQIFDWLNRANNIEIEAFNDRVYSEIFKTPASDAWLGLYSADVYAALDGNGIVR